MNTTISDAAVEAACQSGLPEGVLWRDLFSIDEQAEAFKNMRAALEAALPHLHPAKPEAVRLRDELRERTDAPDLNTSEGGRRLIAEFFARELRRNDFGRYINTALAADFACALAQYLAARQPVEQGPVAYWLAVDKDGVVEFGMSADDANGGQASRQEVNDFINGPLYEGGAPHRLVGVYAAPPAQAVDLAQPNDPGRTLYIDLDGVMADFDGAFPAIFGLDHRSLADDEMWGHINSHPSFFRDLPPMAGALDFFRSVEHLNPVILTACPKSNYPHVAAQKRAWVRAHLSQTCMVLPVLGGRHKPLFMHQTGDVLIDDFGKNCAAWTDAGGIAIKHEGDWTATRAALALIDGGKAVGNG